MQPPTEKDKGNRLEQAMAEQAQSELKKALERMPNAVPILFFASPGVNDRFSEATRQIMRALRELTDKIPLREFTLDHAEARKWKVSEGPTLLLDPDHFPIRWMGAPVGEETRGFIDAILMLGYRNTQLSAEAAGILKKIEEPRSIKVFVSLTCPYCPQQAINAIKAVAEHPDRFSAEIIDVQAFPHIAEKYAAQSVPQTVANEKLIALGAQTEELFALSLSRMEQQSIFIPDSDAEQVDADLLIVGGGPAGLSAGIYGARSGLVTVVVEKDILGGQVALTPQVDNYPGLTQVGGKALVDLLVTHALEYVRIFPGEEILEIQPGDPLLVRSTRRQFRVRALLLATGARHRTLEVPGEARLAGKGVSYCSTCDGPLFRGKRVIQVGGGNSAVTDALHLANLGVQVTLVHRRDKLRAQEHLAQQVFANDLPVLFNTAVQEIRGKDKVEEVLLFDNQTGKTFTQPADAVFIAIGYTPAVELAQKLGVALTPDGYIQHDDHHRTNIPRVYSAGDVEGGFKQIVTAVGHGSAAAMSIFEDLIHPYWQNRQVG